MTSATNAVQPPIAIVRSVEVNQAAASLKVEPWQVDAIRKIVHLRKLPAGWDGYGSPPVGEKVANWALRLVLDQSLKALAAPEFFPESGGALQINWFSGFKRELELHISPDGMVEFLKTGSGDTHELPTVEKGETDEEGSFAQSDGEKILALMAWLRKG